MSLVIKGTPQTAVPGADVVLTQAAQNVGAALSVTAKGAENPGLLPTNTVPGSCYLVFGSFDMDVGATSTNGLLTGQLLVDGVAQAQKAVMNDTGVGVRNCTDQQWLISGLAPGVHTFQLSALKANATGTGTVRAANTSLIVVELSASYLD